MKVFIPAISAALAGAAAMYFLDPAQGKRRRAMVRDKVVSASAHTGEVTRAQGRRVAHRVQGWAAGVRSHLPGHATVIDPQVLHHRVRSNIGHVVSHPKAVHVDVLEDCTVCLSGHILEDELADLLETAGRVPGVSGVENRMTVHAEAGNIPELQGDGRRWRNGPSRWWAVLALAAPIAVMAATARPGSHRKSLFARFAPQGRGLIARFAPHRASLVEQFVPQRRSLLARLAPRRESLVSRLTPHRKSLVARLMSDRESLPSVLSPRRRRNYFSALRAS